MAVLTLNSTEKTDGYRGQPMNDHGKVRFQYFNLDAIAAAGDATSEINLCDLPPGRVRVVPSLCRLNNSAFGAARTLNIGHRTYQKRDNPSETFEVEDDNAFADAVDVAAANNGVAFGNGTKFDLYSKGGVSVFAIVNGGTIPIGATLSGFVAYIYE